MAKGIEERHSRSCRSAKRGRCDCERSYRADVWDGRAQRRIRRTFSDRAEAASWRRDAVTALRRGRQVATRHAASVREAWTEWERLAKAGVLRPRPGEPYKPAALRSYERHMRLRVFPEYGDEPLADLGRTDWQALADKLLVEAQPSTVQGTVAAVGAVYRYAISRGQLKDNPTRGLDVPTPNGRRDRIADPPEAAARSALYLKRTAPSGLLRCTPGCVAASCRRYASPTCGSTQA